MPCPKSKASQGKSIKTKFEFREWGLGERDWGFGIRNCVYKCVMGNTTNRQTKTADVIYFVPYHLTF
jgi:hypothetical protein